MVVADGLLLQRYQGGYDAQRFGIFFNTTKQPHYGVVQIG